MNEVLHPDLARHITDLGGRACLSHPLLIDSPYSTARNAECNRRYSQKKASLSEAIRNSDWTAAVFTHERPYRLEALVEYEPRIAEDQDYWSLLGRVLTDSNNLYQYRHEIRVLLCLRRREWIRWMMTEDERAAFDELPDTVHIYRGTRFENDDGVSWTTDLGMAVWFAEKHILHCGKGHPLLLSAVAPKSKIIAHFTRRFEHEVLILPEHVRETSRERLSGNVWEERYGPDGVRNSNNSQRA